jgi:hypothetical protein
VVAGHGPATVEKIEFDNVPDLSHVGAGARRATALKQYRQWEDQLAKTPMSTLHYQLTGKFPYGLHRETVAFVTAKYCTKNTVSFESLMTSVQEAGGQPNIKGLVTTRRSDLKPVVNLLALPDNVLWGVYCSIPDHHRQAEKPPKPPRSPRPSDLKARCTIGKKKKPRFAPKAIHLAEATPVEEMFVWVCCDACSKWRRLFNTTEDEVPDKWHCSSHPDDLRCDDPEDEMEDGEKWDGEMRGATSVAEEATFSTSVSSSAPHSGLASPARASSPTGSQNSEDSESSESITVAELATAATAATDAGPSAACPQDGQQTGLEGDDEDSNLFDLDE